MKTELITITPEIASEYIKHNANNRKVNRELVNRYAQDIIDGRWQLNGDSIKFKADGTLFDGQHRLLAIIKAQRSVDSIVVTDIPNESYVCDTQRKRTFANQVAMSSIEIPVNAGFLAAGIRLYSQINKDKSYSDAYVMEFYENHRNFLEAATLLSSRGSSSKNSRIQHKAFCTAGYYIAMRSGLCDSGTLELFADTVNSGIVSSTDQNAAIVFRNFLLDNTNKRTHYRAAAIEMIDIMLRAIEDFKEGKSSKFYRRAGTKDSTGAIAKAIQLDFGDEA